MEACLKQVEIDRLAPALRPIKPFAALALSLATLSFAAPAAAQFE